jgi:hypothetical protein
MRCVVLCSNGTSEMYSLHSLLMDVITSHFCVNEVVLFPPNSFASLGPSKLNLEKKEKTKKSQPTQTEKTPRWGGGNQTKKKTKQRVTKFPKVRLERTIARFTLSNECHA